MHLKALLVGCVYIYFVTTLLGCVGIPAEHHGGFRITSSSGQIYYSRIINFVGIDGWLKSNKEKGQLAAAYLDDARKKINNYRTGIITTKVNVHESSSRLYLVEVPAENYTAWIFRRGDVEDFKKLGIERFENGGSWGVGIISFISHLDNKHIQLEVDDTFRVDRISEEDYLNSLHDLVSGK